MKYLTTVLLPFALLLSGCDGGGNTNGGGGLSATSSGRMPINPKGGSAPALTVDPDAISTRGPIGNTTAPARR